MAKPTIQVVVPDDDPARKLRREWGDSLAEHLDTLKMSRKSFQHALEEAGLKVSHQAISQWIAGETSPRPHYQAVIASVLRVPVRRLFPIDTAA